MQNEVVSKEGFTQHVKPSKSWRKIMECILDLPYTDYRKMVRQDPRFVPYFRQVTPELELRTK